MTDPTDDREPWEVYQDDIHDLLEALDLGTHARPESPHEVLQEEVLPAIRELRGDERDAPTDTDAEPTPTFPTAPWDYSRIESDVDVLEHYDAAVWDGMGDLVCPITTQLAGNGEIEHAHDRAALIAAAGSAAHEVPEEYDAVEAVEALPQLIKVAERALRDLGAQPHLIDPDTGEPGDAELNVVTKQLQDALDAARTDS